MKQVDFSRGSITQNVAQVAVPMLVADLLSLLYNIVDRIYIGRIPGEGTIALAGVGLCFPIITLILAFTSLYGVGGAPICAHYRGQGDKVSAERVMNTSFVLLCTTGIVLMVIAYLTMRPMLFAFGASDVTIQYAIPYLQIYLYGTIPSMIASGMNPFINAQGFPGVGMLTIFIGALANIVLDPLFIFTFGMGVRGAAIATVISQCLSMVIVLVFLTRGKAELRILPSVFRHIRQKDVGNIVGLGFSSFIMKFTNSLVAIVCNMMLSWYGGDTYISIYTIISSVRQILEVPVGSFTDGSSPVISFNDGAKRYDRVKGAIRIATLWAVGYTAVIWLLIFFRPGMFIRIFSSDDALVQEASAAMHLYFFAFLFQSLQSSGQNVFKSLNMKKQAIFFSLFRKVIMVVPLTLILPRFLGSNGVFLAEPISNLIGGSACFLTMYLTVYRKLGTQI
ncbi:MAG: MATE family efflux transporter [Sphaerochaeta sp.]|jgi:putative MATE family efflux protein|nr:MATE family efflux transporter [Sphaerochaeta sp.]